MTVWYKNCTVCHQKAPVKPARDIIGTQLPGYVRSFISCVACGEDTSLSRTPPMVCIWSHPHHALFVLFEPNVIFLYTRQDKIILY